MKLDHYPVTGEDWNMILTETVEEAICRVGYHLAGKETIPLKVYRQWVDGLRFQLVETWCLSRYHQQHDPDLRRTGVCVRDLRTCIDYLKAIEESAPGTCAALYDRFGRGLLWYSTYLDPETMGLDGFQPFSRQNALAQFLLQCGCDPARENVNGLAWEDLVDA